MKTLAFVMAALAVVQALDCSKRKCPTTHNIIPDKKNRQLRMHHGLPEVSRGHRVGHTPESDGKCDVTRAFAPRFFVGDWLSAELVTTIASILAEDAMGSKSTTSTNT